MQKTEPAGKVSTYEYETPGDRSFNSGWDGVLASTSSTDDTVAPPVNRALTACSQGPIVVCGTSGGSWAQVRR